MSFKKFTAGLFGGSIILLITINLFNVINYVFHISMARMLSVSDYGILVALMSVLYVFTFSSESIQTIIAKYSLHEPKAGKVKNIISKSLKKGLKLSIILLAVYLVIAIAVSYFASIEYALVALMGLMIFSVFTAPITRGVLQGKKKFNSLGFNMIIEAVVKVALAILLVYIGWRVYGAVLAVFLGAFVSFLLSFLSLKEIVSSKEEKSNTLGIYKYSIPVIVTMFVITFFYSMDVLIARFFFSGEAAGQYAIASTIAKIIFFGTLPISKAMFPISSASSSNEEKSGKILSQAVLILSACIALALLIVYLFPGFLVSIFSGRAIPESSAILIFVSIAISLVSFANLILLYKISIGKTKNCLSLLLFVLIELLLFFFFSHNLLEFSIAFITSSAVLLWGSVMLLNK